MFCSSHFLLQVAYLCQNQCRDGQNGEFGSGHAEEEGDGHGPVGDGDGKEGNDQEHPVEGVASLLPLVELDVGLEHGDKAGHQAEHLDQSPVPPPGLGTQDLDQMCQVVLGFVQDLERLGQAVYVDALGQDDGLEDQLGSGLEESLNAPQVDRKVSPLGSKAGCAEPGSDRYHVVLSCSLYCG